jgi:hypothetical protein
MCDDLVLALAKRGFGEAGPPRETTFAAIEDFGHRVGRMLARAVDVCVAARHAGQFLEVEPCPTCGVRHSPNSRPHDLEIRTRDGDVPLHEPAFRCPPCERDLFPSANRVAN